MNTTPDERAADLVSVCRELRGVARRMLRREPYEHTLESLELVHQAWAKVLAGELRDAALADPRAVVALVVLNMRRELVDHARRRRAGKRPDARARIDLDDAQLMSHRDPDAFLLVEALLDQLPTEVRIRNGGRKAEIARYALYLGFSEAEIADTLGLPKSTVGNDLRFVRAWLVSRLGDPT
jgi:RNA polymerase sigma factor (TIGR02999 family)